jgi:hypothetical protein
MSLNIPLGSYVQDGVRTGPIYTGQLPNGLKTNLNGVITSNDYTTYGPGVLVSTQNSYNITPSPPNPVGGFDTTTNLVGPTDAVPSAQYLTIRGDNAATYLTTGPNGLPLVQFDWPRVPIVAINGATATPDTHVTIFGYDYYGYPMQHTYIIGAEGSYPTVTIGSGATFGSITYPDGTTPLPCKAFYQVTAVYISAALPDSCFISVGAGDIFGLPYVANSDGVVSAIQWGIQLDNMSANPIFPTSDMTVRSIGGPFTTLGVFVPADLTKPATASTGDTRGLYAPSSPAAAYIFGGKAVNWKNLIFTYYIAGEDNWINQVSAAQQQFMQQNNTNIPQGIPIAPLVVSNAYGVSQFYTGVPS